MDRNGIEHNDGRNAYPPAAGYPTGARLLAKLPQQAPNPGAGGPVAPGVVLPQREGLLAPWAGPAGARQWQHLPECMRRLLRWGLADGKRPVTVRGGQVVGASSTRPGSWMPFEDAYAEAHARGLGLGFFMHKGDGLTVADVDVKNHINEPDHPELWTPAPKLARLVAMVGYLESYTELSRSGQGAHVWMFGELRGRGISNKAAGAELYDDARFMAVTGHAAWALPVSPRQDRIDALELALRAHEQRHGAACPVASPPPCKPAELEPAAALVLAQFRKGDKTGRLARALDGDLGDYGWDYSKADQAVLAQLFYYTRAEDVVLKVWRTSALGQRLSIKPELLGDGDDKVRAREAWQGKPYRESYVEPTLVRAKAPRLAQWAAEDALMAQRPAMDAAIDAELRAHREAISASRAAFTQGQRP